MRALEAPLGVIVDEAGGRSSVESDDARFRLRVNNRALEADLAALV